MRMRTFSFAALAAAVALASLLVPAAWAQSPKRGGVLPFVVPASDFPSMDAHQETTFAVIHPVGPFYSLLIRVKTNDPTGNALEGDAAESWTVSPDGKTYTFKLHPGINFHDGSPLLASDVVATYQKIMHAPKGTISPRSTYFLMVDAVTAQGDDTVVFKLKFPTSAFLPAVAAPYNFLYKADQIAKDPTWFKTHINGSGPFRMKSYTPGASMVGVRNENYFKPGRPYLDGFEATFADKESVQVAAIRGGRAYVNFRGFPPTVRDDLVRAMGSDATVQESSWNCSLFAVPNSKRKPFDDPRVRRALNLAVDRWNGSKYLSRIALVKTVGGLVFPGSPLALSESELEQVEGYSKDIEASRAKARELLREAGIPNGYKFKLNNRSTDQPYKIVGTWLIDQWRQIGLDVEQQVMPTSTFYKALRGGESLVSMDFNCQSIVNPTLDIAKFISSDKSSANDGKYIDRELDRLFEAQMREPNQPKQKALIKQFEQRIADNAYYINTLWWHRIIIQNAKLKGWQITPSHYLNNQLEDVWLDQ
ncbi:MAG: ABC transporter substrate-binding protein [Candidatus Lambdaproteobacteria bacterium]|nr:ABC transporter substrate-binding protein [Candidatus Lambdaproteobacteria bacterium]